MEVGGARCFRSHIPFGSILQFVSLIAPVNHTIVIHLTTFFSPAMPFLSQKLTPNQLQLGRLVPKLCARISWRRTFIFPLFFLLLWNSDSLHQRATKLNTPPRHNTPNAYMKSAVTHARLYLAFHPSIFLQLCQCIFGSFFRKTWSLGIKLFLLSHASAERATELSFHHSDQLAQRTHPSVMSPTRLFRTADSHSGFSRRNASLLINLALLLCVFCEFLF